MLRTLPTQSCGTPQANLSDLTICALSINRSSNICEHLPFQHHPEMILHCCHQLPLVCNQISTDWRFGTFWDYESLNSRESSARLSPGQSFLDIVISFDSLEKPSRNEQFNFSVRDAKKHTPDIDFIITRKIKDPKKQSECKGLTKSNSLQEHR